MNRPVVERSLDICGYYWKCHEQHAQYLCGYCWNCHEQHAQQLCDSIHFHKKNLYVLCYRQKCTLIFYLDYFCKIGLTWHGQVVCFVVSTSLSCYWHPY